jgi:putative ABC transport system ATP-binding protein
VTGPAQTWGIAGLRRPNTGDVLVDARPIDDQERALTAGVALIPQDNALASLLTAFENVLVHLTRLRGQHDP